MANYVLPISGEWSNQTYPSKTTTAYAEGEWLANDGTNDIPATTTSQLLRGINITVKAVGTSGTAQQIMRVPQSVNCTFRMVVSGTLTADMVGRGFDLASSTTVNQAASTYKPVILVQFIDANTGIFKLNLAEGVNAS